MKSTTMIGLFGIIVSLSACYRLTDGEVITRAHGMYEAIKNRYYDLCAANNPAEFEQQACILASTMQMGFGDVIWTGMTGRDYLTNSNGAPLHRAVFFINKDIQEIEGYLCQLECRLLSSMPLYYKLKELHRDLCALSRTLQAHTHYVEEAQFIEQQKVQGRQLRESERQTQLLKDMAAQQRVKKEAKKTEQTIIIVR